ncbi:PTS galactitol transporter subunit IIC [Cuneatibacter sp. NSJ-177]|uniref:PTS galactitol transporter subunit IIC n=1 Tax=Cuneatibacter sp. NSJ-177 TaxID=2931401 RepID=UPI001FD3BFCE|nr:PTS galactitol transporter subunit IIC [Cuneatibacter sp. NSJ-177]
MEAFVNAFLYLLNLGAAAILPVSIFLMGLLFRLKPGQALKCGIVTGIGYIGISLTINLLMDNLGAAAQQMVDRLNLSLDVIDGGWASGAAAAWGFPISALLVLVCILVNIGMIVTGLTKTMFIDIWNYWHLLFIGVTVQAVTGSVILSVAATALAEAAILITADKTAPLVQSYFGLEGVSLPTASAMMWVPLGFGIDWVLERIPGVKNWNVDGEWMKKHLGIFGEPAVLGVILGCGLGLLAGYDAGAVWNLGIHMGAVMFLMPKMVEILVEGLRPLTVAAQEMVSRRFQGRKLLISLDAGVAIGHPSVISTALLLVPVMILLAAILPGNRVLPFGDLASIPFFVAFIVAHNKGNILKSVLTGTVLLAVTLLMASDFAPAYTQVMGAADYVFPDGMSQMSSLSCGGNPFNWILIRLAGLF